MYQRVGLGEKPEPGAVQGPCIVGTPGVGIKKIKTGIMAGIGVKTSGR